MRGIIVSPHHYDIRAARYFSESFLQCSSTRFSSGFPANTSSTSETKVFCLPHPQSSRKNAKGKNKGLIGLLFFIIDHTSLIPYSISILFNWYKLPSMRSDTPDTLYNCMEWFSSTKKSKAEQGKDKVSAPDFLNHSGTTPQPMTNNESAFPVNRFQQTKSRHTVSFHIRNQSWHTGNQTHPHLSCAFSLILSIHRQYNRWCRSYLQQQSMPPRLSMHTKQFFFSWFLFIIISAKCWPADSRFLHPRSSHKPHSVLHPHINEPNACLYVFV